MTSLYPPMNTLPLPTATFPPHDTGSPMRPACLPFMNTVPLPEAITPVWGGCAGQPCAAYESPTRPAPRPFIFTSGLPDAKLIGGHAPNHARYSNHQFSFARAFNHLPNSSVIILNRFHSSNTRFFLCFIMPEAYLLIVNVDICSPSFSI